VSRLFGTDGVRGVANAELTPELAFRIGRAGALVLHDGGDDQRPIVVGRDTRVSGSMLEAAIVAGITSAGRNALLLGIVPTPAVATVARRTGAAAGVMISASHNPVPDNGIKFFSGDGFKLPDELELEIERAVDIADPPRPTGTGVGVVRSAFNLGRHYYAELQEAVPSLEGLEVIIDAGFGAAYAVAPYVMRKLGARVVELNCEADGSRINVACGTTDLRQLRDAVRTRIGEGARVIGVAFDGDADRALFVDETAEIVSGDHVLFAMARDMHERAELAHDTVVATVMSNIGFERALAHHSIGLVRTGVGDRYVLERMREGGYTLGGEQSGHVLDLRYNNTGDGPRTATTLLGIVAARRTSLHELVREVQIAPQILVNVTSRDRDVLLIDSVREEIAAAQAALGSTGRLLIRPSGTEPLIRVMAEGEDFAMIEEIAQRVAARIKREADRFSASGAP
jgi:phosphoglucosamine mutase